MGQFGLTLGPIYSRVGASIQHPSRAVRLHRGTAGLRVGQIQRVQTGTAAAAGSDQLHPLGLRGNQRLAQLAGGAGEQHLHGVSPAGERSKFCTRCTEVQTQLSSSTWSSASNGAPASLSESWGASSAGIPPVNTSRGQAIAPQDRPSGWHAHSRGSKSRWSCRAPRPAR